jgi:tripartite-type tricarboxylate transporter receptor subunit TctC
VVAANSVLLVNPASGIASVDDLLALARANPGKLSYGSAGIGTIGHLNIEAMKARTGITLDHLAYKGESDALLAVIRGDIALTSMSVSTALPHVKAGTVRAIATTGMARSTTLPDLPTLAETVPGVGGGSWIGLFGPAGLPADVVLRIQREVDHSMRTSDMKERLVANDLAYMPMSPAGFGEFQKAEIRRFGEIIRANGIRIE